MTDEFKQYSRQVLQNVQALAEGCALEGMRLITGGTNNHMVMLDVTPVIESGQEAERVLNSVGIATNKNAIPFDTLPPSIASAKEHGI